MDVHIPALMNTTIGREHECALLVALLRREDVRLLTLVGTGGVGKSRLALEVARALQDDFANGIFFVSLAALHDHTLVLPALARVLGIEDVPGLPLIERCKAYLHERALLLILDNFEHVLPARLLLADLLAAAPNVKLLVTSREVLHLYGEHEFGVQPLSYAASADDDPASVSPAASLFLERARAIRSTFTLSEGNREVVQMICQQLEGIPLSIELAAARCKILSPREILDRLQDRLKLLTGGARDLPARQQSLRNALDWSYELLTEHEKGAFCCSAVLHGQWKMEAAEAVWLLDDTSDSDVFDLLASLVDKSLLRVHEYEHDATHFSMLETVQEYAMHRLRQSGVLQEIEQRHAMYYLAIAEEANRHLHGREQRSWLQRLDAAAGNIWAAFRWLLMQRQVVPALRLLVAMGEYVQWRGLVSEASNWIEEGLALTGSMVEHALLARTLYLAGMLAWRKNELALTQWYLDESRQHAELAHEQQLLTLTHGMLAAVALHRGHSTEAAAYAEQALQLVQAQKDRWVTGVLYRVYGDVAAQNARFEQARMYYELSLKMLRELGDEREEAAVLVSLGTMMRSWGRLRSASILYQRASSLFRQMEDHWGAAGCLLAIGEVLRYQGRYAQALDVLDECLTLAAEQGNQRDYCLGLIACGRVLMVQGQNREAIAKIKESLRLAKEIAYQPAVVQALVAWGDVERLSGELVAAHLHYEQSLKLTRAMGDKVNMAGGLYGQGECARLQQDYLRGGILLKQAIYLCRESGERVPLPDMLDAFAQLCIELGYPELAVQILAAAAHLREALEMPLAPIVQEQYERVLAGLQMQMSEPVYRENWSVGRVSSLTEVLQMVADTQVTVRKQPLPLPSPVYPAGLTNREVEVLRLVARGYTDRQIAQELVLSPRTVNTHLRSIYAKLDVSTRSAATRFAVEQNIV